MSDTQKAVNQAEVESMVEILFTGRRFEVLAKSLPTIIRAFPESPLLLAITGAMCQIDGQEEAANRYFKKAMNIEGNSENALRKIVQFLCHVGYAERAVEWALGALKENPKSAVLHHAIGRAQMAIGDVEQALYSFGTTIKLDPDCAEAYVDLGNLLITRGEHQLALSLYERAERQLPAHAVIQRNKASAFQLLGRQVEAVAALTRAHELSPKSNHVLAQLLFRKRYICDWSEFPPKAEIEQLGLLEDLEPIPPWSMLCLDDSEARQAERSAIYARHSFARSLVGYQGLADPHASRIKVGYFSADFHGHATMTLIAGLFRCHDKKRFDIYCYDYGSKRDAAIRQTLLSYGCKVVDIHGVPDSEVLRLTHQHGLHIACDLNGYTAYSRTSLFAKRVAPIQINYLAYPGPLAADFIDYIIADKTVYPVDSIPSQSEAAILLPDCYQPNDNRRQISDKVMTRQEYGLPDEAIVLCCFNNNYKISPDEFDIWMRVMAKTPNTVLWLLADNEVVEKNLKKEASKRFVSPERLIFAPRVPPAEHLARHRLADIFVDTFYVNAHTTAADALWAGIPLLTLLGHQFAARVAASILNAMGLPELVMKSAAEYEKTLLKLVADPDELVELKSKVQANRDFAPLFDTKLYTQNFERALEIAFERYRSGLPATMIQL